MLNVRYCIHLTTFLGFLFSLFLPVRGFSDPFDSIVSLEKESQGKPPFFRGEHGLETIVVLGTNDIHGTLFPLESKTVEKDSARRINYTKGGLTVFASYLQILQEQFKDRLIWLDGGDEFQGSLESNAFFGASMVSFFNELGLTAAAIGNHEFDFGLDVLIQRMKDAKYSYVAANIVDKNTKKLPATFSHTAPSILRQVGKLTVGIVGFSTKDTPHATKPSSIESLLFLPARDAILKEAQALRKQGAQLVILVTHAGLKCSTPFEQQGLRLRKVEDLQGDCESEQEIVELLHLLPAGTLDAVVAGHTHEVVHHFVEQGSGPLAKSIPVIEGGVRGAYTNLIYLTYDLKQKQLRTEFTRMEGPIPICEKVFASLRNCDGSQPADAGGRGPLVIPTFHGHPIVIRDEIKSSVKDLAAQIEQKKKKVVGYAARPISHTKRAESEQGNLVADAMRDQAKTDVSLINGGGIRAPWDMGPILFGDLFRSIPFDNAVVVAQVSGRELKRILRAAQSGKYEWFSVSGLRLRLIPLEESAPAEDMNGDGKIEPFEINRIIEATLENGDPIDDQHQYTLATVDFLVSGGDGMGPVFSEIAKEKIQPSSAGFLRDVVQSYLQKTTFAQKEINSVTHPLIDPAHPRLILVRSLLSEKF